MVLPMMNPGQQQPGPPMTPAGPAMGVAPLPGMNPQPQPPVPAPSPLGMMGGPEGAQPMMGEMDPLSSLDDPQVMSALLDLMAEMEELQNGPIYPRWYKPKHYPKPKISDVIAKVNQDHELYQLLIKRIRADRRLLRLMDVGKFKDADDIEVTFQDASLVHDLALVITLLAGCDLNFEAKAKNMGERELAEKKEQFSHALRDQTSRRHFRIHGTDLSYDEAKFATETGHVVYRLELDFDAESDEIPVIVDLLDPVTCYPTWDRNGLLTVTRLYADNVGTIVNTWDDDGEKGIEAALTSQKFRDPTTQADRYRTLDDKVEIMEYWDRRWKIIVASGVEVVRVEHRFGFVPFHYGRSPFGDAGPMSLEALHATHGQPSGMTALEIASKGLSHIWATKTTHLQREAILGRLMTELKKSANPDRTFSQTPDRYGKKPLVSNAEGSISMLLEGSEKELPPVQKPGLSLAPPVLAAVGEANQRGMMPAAAYGVTMNANQSGTAIEGMNESGRDKTTPWLKMLCAAHIDVAEKAMTLVRDWGHLLGSEGQRGTFFIERSRPVPGKDDTIMLTPAELRQVGVKINCKMTSLRLSNLGNLGQAIMPWIQGGMMEKVEAMELRGVQDPLAALRRIEIEQFKSDPAYKQVAIMRWLQEEGLYEDALLYQQIISAQGGAQGGPPPSPAGGLQGGAQPPQAQNGGAPGGPIGPNQAQGGQGSMGMPSRLPGPPPSTQGLPPGAM